MPGESTVGAVARVFVAVMGGATVVGAPLKEVQNTDISLTIAAMSCKIRTRVQQPLFVQ